VNEGVKPQALEIYIGSFGSAAYGLWWDGQRLVYESFLSGYEHRQQTTIDPSDAQWGRFWRTMDELDVWSWDKRYDPGERFEPENFVRDGMHWSLTLAHAGRRVESAGDSSGPGSTDLDDSTEFDEFAKAVSRLTGGYAFG
jgi:hypothetical protein